MTNLWSQVKNMSDLSVLLHRLKQGATASETGHLEDAATLMLVGMVALITLAGWF